MATPITLAAFGVQFIRQVFNPSRLARQFNKQLPPPISGTAAINDAGIGTASYVARVAEAWVAPSNTLGTMRVTLQIDLDITIKLLATMRFKMRVMVPFWIDLQTYKPVVVFVNVTPVNVNDMAVLPIDPIGGGLSQKIWDAVAAQVRPVLAQEVSKALAQTHSARVINLLSTMGAAEANGLSTTSVWTGFVGGDLDTPSISSNEIIETATSEVAIAPTELGALDSYSPTHGELSTLAVERVSYESFGSLIFYYLASPSVVAHELNLAMAKAPLSPKIDNNFWFWSLAVPTLGRASVQYLGQNAHEQGLRAILRLKMSVHLDIAHVWREAWEVDIEVPVLMPAQAYDQNLLIFLAAKTVQPSDLVLTPRKTTNTDSQWSSVDTSLRTEIAKEINAALAKSGKDRTKVIEMLVREALKE